jgi:hypothetical protein
MLLCDACGVGYHLECLRPPLSRVPKNSWVCPACAQEGVTPEQLDQLHATEAAQPEQLQHFMPPSRRGRPPGPRARS